MMMGCLELKILQERNVTPVSRARYVSVGMIVFVLVYHCIFGAVLFFRPEVVGYLFTNDKDVSYRLNQLVPL